MRSPVDEGPTDPELSPFFALCERGDQALSRVAARFARRQSDGDAPLDVSEISFALRAEGSPYVWPRAWTLQGGELTGPVAVERMKAWLATFADGGQRRCGVAISQTSGPSVLAAVAVDALGDLRPLPVRTRAGVWLDLNAELLVPATDAKVIVLGPSGAPRALPTSFDGRYVRARVHADRAGSFLFQVMADVSGGPRPVLEATVYAGVAPPTSFFGAAAPGEASPPPPPSADPSATLLAMLNGARRSEHSPPLQRDAALDAIAQRHAETMRQVRRIAHDAGDGDPTTRVETAGVNVLATGENVAHALNVTHAHRALWGSPSHRANLLQPRFDRVGIGIAVDPDGSLWVCEVFSDSAEPVEAQR